MIANGTLIPFSSKPLFPKFKTPHFSLSKIRGINSHLIRNRTHQLDRSSLLDFVSANHQSLQEIYQIYDAGHNNFFRGLGTLFGITIKSLANGGSKIINAVGHGVKQGLQGFGSFNHAVITSIGNATGTVFRSTGSAVKDITTGTGSFFHQILGGISGSIMWSVILLLIAYQIYLKWSTQPTQSRSPSHQLLQDQVVSSTPPVPPNDTPVSSPSSEPISSSSKTPDLAKKSLMITFSPPQTSDPIDSV